MMAWWARLRSYFTKRDTPVVRLGNAILLNALKKHASMIYVDRENGVRYKIDGESKVEFGPVEDRRCCDTLYDLVTERLRWMAGMAGTDERSGTILLLLGKGQKARFEVRPYGRDGLVISIEENPRERLNAEP